MSFLNDLKLDSVKVEESDWSIANGVYPAMINESKIMQSKTGKTLWQITYRVEETVETYGKRTVSEFFDLDPNAEDNKKQFLKRRLQSLSITDGQAATLEPADIIGTEVTITVKNKQVNDKTYTNVSKVTLGHDEGMSSISNNLF